MALNRNYFLNALPEQSRAIGKRLNHAVANKKIADEQRRQAEPYEVRLALVGLRSPNHRNVGCFRRLVIT
jgi:hypothetical protein